METYTEPEHRTKTIALRVTPADHKRIKILAVEKDTTIINLVLDALLTDIRKAR